MRISPSYAKRRFWFNVMSFKKVNDRNHNLQYIFAQIICLILYSISWCFQHIQTEFVGGVTSIVGGAGGGITVGCVVDELF